MPARLALGLGDPRLHMRRVHYTCAITTPHGHGCVLRHRHKGAHENKRGERWTTWQDWEAKYGRHGSRTVDPTTRQLAGIRRRYGYGHKLEPWQHRMIDKARRALGVIGTRYPAGLSREATLDDGTRVRLLASTGRGRTSTHRIQFHCPHCAKWVPAGRYGQHIVVHYPYAGRSR